MDLRPVTYIIGLLVAALGATMVFPLMADLLSGAERTYVFALSAFVTVTCGAGVALASRQTRLSGLTIQQTFILTTGIWAVLPVFGALPFSFGEQGLGYTDAFFEAMSGLTTTGSTVYTKIDNLPEGILLWRGMLQWFGGIGIVVFAIAFLPMLKVGGMQLFQSESYDSLGSILPRAAQIAASIWRIYLGLTLFCALAYAWAGMGFFDAIVHAMTTIATGGFSNYDASFGAFEPAVEYVAALFMIAASLPFVRYVQLLAGSAQPLWRDSQVRTFLTLAIGVVTALALWQALTTGSDLEFMFRKSLFNGVSILTGTGYASDDYNRWGSFPVALFFLIGLIGGCAGSTCCSIKIFRYQLLLQAIRSQIKLLHSPNGVFAPKYEGRAVTDEVYSSVMAFFVMFMSTLLGVSVLLSFMGLDTITAVSGAAAALANIGPGLGPEIGPAGNFSGLPPSAKWLLSGTMLIGRLELLSVYVLFTFAFWRR